MSERPLCTATGCTKQTAYGRRLYCGAHFKSWYKYGDPLITKQARKGEGCTDPRGYKKLGRHYVHRLVMKKKLGRELTYDDNVHHKDEDKGNNDEDNLELKTRAAHSREHTTARYA